MRRLAALILSAGLAGAAQAPEMVRAQDVGIVQSQILVLDPEQLFERSKLGQALAADLQAQREALIARNRDLEAQLSAEEQALTDLRDTTSPEEFRDMADAFDEKVQQIRRDSDARVRRLERNRERAPVDFMRRVEPVLVELMREAGGLVVLDRRNVLIQAGVIDITEIAVARIDAILGDGRDATGETQPETQPSTEPETEPATQD
ncbi:OmpH family outer membrane protein [Roseovarius aestuariivivens]|uniref:OmpH family outer membrane protein n=1 Tax=Roseovarius aestuariivivens TaxID=1888910 RepID=UPI001080A7DE|nr:OmpH family outer membrane protein [Roseovarius aestuariivivens]